MLSGWMLHNATAGETLGTVIQFHGCCYNMMFDAHQVDWLTKRGFDVFMLEPIIEMEKPLEIFARLNIKHGPNTEQVVRELPLNDRVPMVEFDLAYTKLNEKRVESMWLDLIFEGPEMNQVALRDLTFSRRPRAQI